MKIDNAKIVVTGGVGLIGSTTIDLLVADDHSDDGTFSVVAGLAKRDSKVRGIRLAHRSGSHTAITCALHHAQGDTAILMAADLQDPPEFIQSMLDRWRAGAQVV